MTKIASLLGAAILAMSSPFSAAAEDLSGGTIKIIVPFNAGGSLDPVARLMAEYMGPDLGGATVIVENLPGGGGVIGAQQLVRAAPDGRTLIVVSPSHALNPLFRDELPYDTFADFTPISKISEQGNVMIAPAEGDYRSVQDVIDAGKSADLPIQYGASGTGTSNHLGGLLLAYMGGFDIEPVMFTGGAETLTAVLGNHIPLGFSSIPGAIAQIQEGTVLALGVTSSQRNPGMPDVPTISEAGMEGYEAINWWGVLGPAGMDPAVVATINKAVVNALTNPEAVERLAKMGVVPDTSTPEEFDAFIRSEYEKWKPVVEKMGVKQ